MPVVKGGVWQNLEDEILKAAVSKYGLNQWARVSSLLARKTAKQCKARWNEWLDPSIKKIEWSKEEDERLLHLAKLMPSQWRTVAPMVGRTANQCLERYQKLLDEADQRESGLGLTGANDETQAPSAADVRRLRPGEVDPDPETKPARPDTVDLDEDEKEMLSEARARLANTQGKKAKRKARERQQEEAKRLAALQKRRELKTAGINIKVTTRKKGQMDYNADIPFEHKPVPGFYDTSEEKQRNDFQRANFDPKKLQTGGKRKGDQDDDEGRKRRKNENKEGLSEAAKKAAQMQKIREAEQSSKRRALVLPSPQVGENELEDIVKMGMVGERANLLARESENEATRGLVSDYAALNSNAPIRTPMAPAQEDHIANEIRNIRALTNTQSSLLGGENTPLHEGSASTGFDSAKPRQQVMATPNPLATPFHAGPNGLATPARPGQTPMRTPRDSFALNTTDTPGDTKTRGIAMRQQLLQSLASLPKPKDTEWELELPDEQEEPKTAEELEEDAADRDRREREYREAQELLERRRRTQVMQRGLPRPIHVDANNLVQAETAHTDPAEALIAQEAAQLIAFDSVKFPLPGAKPGRAPVVLEQFDDNSLAEARLQIALEATPSSKESLSAWDKENPNALLLGLGCYDDEEDQDETMSILRGQIEAVQDATIEWADKGSALEKKLEPVVRGYKGRAQTLREKIGQAHDALEEARNALMGFQRLQISEEAAIQRRLGALRDEVGFVSTREREAQELYRRTKAELDSLTSDGTNGYH